MINLDDINAIKQSDDQQVITATNNLWRQCEQAWHETIGIELPSDYSNVDHVVIVGMGGSHLGGNLIRSIYDDSLKLPIIIKSDYSPPGFISDRSLILATSYSGNTEEVLSFSQSCLERKAKIICISSGGKLAEFAQQNNLPHYVFDDSENNPTSIPRYGSGYLFMSQMVFLLKIHDLDISGKEESGLVNHLKLQQKRFGLEVLEVENIAKQMARSLHQKSINIISSQHLTGSAYIFKNQLNESSKNFSNLFEIPELNHHLLEGLSHPSSLKDEISFVFIDSNLYHPRNQIRFKITKKLLTQRGFTYTEFQPQSTTKLNQAFETLAFTSYLALYLSILNEENPGPNPWVDYFKNKLSDS